jgi:hypothetical protein
MREDIHAAELVDIRTVSVDTALSRQERIIEFIRQIKNPHKFKCGDFIVTACFSKDGLSLEECLEQIIA